MPDEQIKQWIFHLVTQYLGCSIEQVTGRTGKQPVPYARKLIIFLLRTETDYACRDIARSFFPNLHRSMISIYYYDIKDQMAMPHATAIKDIRFLRKQLAEKINGEQLAIGNMQLVNLKSAI